MRRISTGVALAAAAGALTLVPAAAQAADHGTLTFRNLGGTVLEQHVDPRGCYNVPKRANLVQAEFEGTAILIDGPECEGPELGELGPAPAPVYANQSVFVLHQ